MSGAKSGRKRAGEQHAGRVSNNTLAVLTLVFMMISISSSIIVYMGTESERPMVGFSTSQDSAYISVMIIGTPPHVVINSPVSCQVINGSFLINASADDGNGNNTITNVSFYYDTGGENWAYIGSDYYDGDILYNYSWDTTLLDDGIYYRVKAEVFDIPGLSSDYIVGYFAINNVDTEPDWTKFKYNTSTNLSLLSEWHAVPNLRLGNTYGFMNFSGRTLNVDGVNLSRYFNITSKKFGMDSSELPCIEGDAYLHFVNVRMVAPNIYRNGVPCPSGLCTLVSNNLRDVVVRVLGFATYQLVNNANYDIWDITDANRTPGSQIRYRGQQVDFFLNLSVSGVVLNSSDIMCFIRFNDTVPFEKLIILKNRSLYEYNRSFNSPGNHYWEIRCNSTDDEFFNISDRDNVTISNRAPRLKNDLPNITMEEDTVAQYINDLNDYFEDMEGDEIRYAVSFIPDVETTVTDNTITIRPARNMFGNRTFVVYATDEFGLQNISNVVELRVIDMPEPPTVVPTGGGGGGSIYDENELEKENPECDDEWVCSLWSDCMFRWTFNITGLNASFENLRLLNENDGIMTRSCTDKNHCNYWWKTPNETQWCFYEPSCRDNIRNQNETGVDCGGPCPSCFSCSDGIQNQGEEGIDCGGPCMPCANCNDGKANCHDGSCELGVDCGGPCPNTCPIEESPAPKINLMTVLLVGLLTLTLLFTFYLFIRPYLVRIYIWIMARRKKREEMPEATLLEIETNYLALLERLRKRAAKADPGSVSDELNTIFRRFLKEAFQIKTEPTLEDLGEMVRKSKLPGMLRIALATYIKEIVKIGYSSAKVSREEAISNIDRARELLDLIVRNMPKKEDNLPEKGERGQKGGKAGQTAERIGKIKKEEAGLAALYKLGIAARRDIVKGDLKAALEIRKEMGKMYKWLKKPARERFSRTLEELDREIKNAKKGDKD